MNKRILNKYKDVCILEKVNPDILSESVQLTAIRLINSYFIERIKSPSYKVKRAAIFSLPYSILHIIDDLEDDLFELAVRLKGNLINERKTPTEKLKYLAVTEKRIYEDYWHMTEARQIDMIRTEPRLFLRMYKPTEKALITAIKLDRQAITLMHPGKLKHINYNKLLNAHMLVYNQGVYTCLSAYNMIMAMRYNTSVFSFLKNSDYHLQTYAIRQNGLNIVYVNKPSREQKLEAVNQNGLAVKFIKKEELTEEIMLAAVNQEGYAIESIIDIAPHSVKVAALKRMGISIKFFKHYKDEYRYQILAVQNSGMAVEFLHDPPECIQLAAVKSNINALLEIKHPTEAVQMWCVKKNPLSLKLIKNPFESVKKWCASHKIEFSN